MMVTADLLELSNRDRLDRGEPLLEGEPDTLARLFEVAADRHDRPDALNYKRDGRWQAISSRDVLRRARTIALGLRELGLERGDRAAILAANSPEWTLADAGCQIAGVIDVPIYTTLAPDPIGYILRDSGARVLFIDTAEAYSRIAEVVREIDTIETVVCFADKVDAANSLTLADLEAKGAAVLERSPDLAAEMAADSKSHSLATLIYTSGTTGEPKGVMLTQSNIISNVIDAGENFAFSVDDRPLSVLPLSHVFERSAMYLYILNGMAVHYAESVDKTPDNLLEVRPTIFVAVPRIFEKVYAKAKLRAAVGGNLTEAIFDRAIDVAKEWTLATENGAGAPLTLRAKHYLADKLVFRKFREFFGGKLRCCITGGAALPDEIFMIFTGAGVPIMQGYGLTETSPVVSTNTPPAIKRGTVGLPIRNVKVRTAQDGEIEVSGPGVMLGYFDRPDATREAFTADGWLRTGDIGEIDTDGYLKITDRKKELFKTSGGKYIAPSPIEQRLASSRFVSQAALIGDERKFASALIVPNFEMLDSYAHHKGFAPMSPQEYCDDPRIIDLFERQIAHVTEGLSQFETVKKFALLDKEFTVDGGELTPTMKLKRRVIEEKFKDTIEKLYKE